MGLATGMAPGIIVRRAFDPLHVPGIVFAYYGWGTGELQDTSDTDTYVGLLDDAGTPTGRWNFTQWDDMTGNGYHATQTVEADQPFLQQNVSNGHSACRFDGDTSTDHFDIGVDLSSLTEGEIFIALANTADPPVDADASGFYTFQGWTGTTGADASHYTWYFDGVIYDSFGTTVRKTVGDPTPSDLTAFHIYNVISASGEWTANMDGTQEFTTATNTVSFDDNPELGASRNVSASTYTYFTGDMMAVLMYDNKLSTRHRTQVLNYLQHRVGI